MPELNARTPPKNTSMKGASTAGREAVSPTVGIAVGGGDGPTIVGARENGSVSDEEDARMTERDAVALAARPATVASLADDLRTLGLGAGENVMVHSSLSRLGYVAGGPVAVVMALCDVVGAEGTIVMPAHSGDLSDPSSWSNPPVPEPWWETIRAEVPAYDPALTPTRMMGAVVECFRHLPGARRSDHPTVSVVARGPQADCVVEGHSLAYGLGEGSPLARLYELDAKVLLLGVTMPTTPPCIWRSTAQPCRQDSGPRTRPPSWSAASAAGSPTPT